MQEFSAYVHSLLEASEEQIMEELSREDIRARTPIELAILMVCVPKVGCLIVWISHSRPRWCPPKGNTQAVQELLALTTKLDKASEVQARHNGEGNSYIHLAASLVSSSTAIDLLGALLRACGESTSAQLLASVNHRRETPLHCAAKIGNGGNQILCSLQLHPDPA